MPEKKLTRKEKFARQKEMPLAKADKKLNPEMNRTKLILGLFIAIVAFFIYSNTLNHGYVLDDFNVIRGNEQTKGGIKEVPSIFKTSYRHGIDMKDKTLYRPLSKAMFAIEWSLSPDNPSIGHFMNVLMYALTCLLLFRVLTKLWKGKLLVPFIASLLFAVHPLHTEVVANIKSRDEIIAFFFCIGALGMFFTSVTEKSRKSLIGGAILFFLALLSKESAITFAIIIPLTLYFFTEAERKKYFRVIIPVAIVSVVFLLIRKSVLGTNNQPIPLADNSLVDLDGFILQRINAIRILGEYLHLLVFPDTLRSDASYNFFPAIDATNIQFIVPFIILVALAVYAMISFRNKDPLSFAILYFFITISLVSNIFILIGTNYGERLMYAPSFGFTLFVAILFDRIFIKEKQDRTVRSLPEFFANTKIPVAICLVVAILFSARTMARNPVWKSDTTLFDQGIKDVPTSAHMLFYYANHITADDYFESPPDSLQKREVQLRAIGALSRAIAIMPGYASAYQLRGYLHMLINQPKKAEADYQKSLEYNPTLPEAYNNYGLLLFNRGVFALAKTSFEKAILYRPDYSHAECNLGSVYGTYGENERILAQRDPANRAQHLSAMNENFQNAIVHFRRAIELEPGFSSPYFMLSATYNSLGDQASAQKYRDLGMQASGQKSK